MEPSTVATGMAAPVGTEAGVWPVGWTDAKGGQLGVLSMAAKAAGDQQEELLESCNCNFASSSINRNAAGDNENQGFWVNGRL